jgi:hypothetical protein
MLNIKTESEKLAELMAGHVDTFVYTYGSDWGRYKDAAKQVRKAIRDIWGLKKSAANEKFRKLFGCYKVAVDSPIVGTALTESFNIKAVDKNTGQVVMDTNWVPIQLGEPPVGGFKVNGDKATLEIKNAGEIRTLEDLVAFCKVDLSKWEPKSFVPSLQRGVLNLRAEFKKRAEKVNIQSLLELFAQEADNFAPKVFYYAPPSNKQDCLYVLNIQDLHLSKLAWAKETGNSYDINIAKEVFTNAVNDLMKKAPKDRIEEVIVICGSDFFQCDQEGTTTAGTFVDTDSRLAKSFEEGVKLLTETIEKLSINHKVRVMCYPGNHDATVSLYAGYYISAWFKNNLSVVVENGPQTRKYYGYGNTLLCFVHGNEEKAADLPLIIMREQMAEVSKYKYIECLCGHLHKDSVTEKNGIKVRVASSLSGEDSWHVRRGFTGNIRTSQGLLYNREQGIEAIYYSNPVK